VLASIPPVYFPHKMYCISKKGEIQMGAVAGAGYGGFWTSTGTILVLYILLVIILRTVFVF